MKNEKQRKYRFVRERTSSLPCPNQESLPSDRISANLVKIEGGRAPGGRM